MSPEAYQPFDQDLIAGKMKWTRDNTIDYLSNIGHHPLNIYMNGIKQFSMLSTEALLLARGFALEAKHILQIGTYIGGSTVAISMGASLSGGSIIAVEGGGSVPDQPYLPTNDIITDFEVNIQKHGFPDRIQLVKGRFEENNTISEVQRLSGGRKFDMFFMDANGEVLQALDNYGHLLQDDCLLIFDDYHNVIAGGGGPDKAEKCMRAIHRCMAEGSFQQYALSPFSTWTGRMARQPKKKGFWSRVTNR